MHDSESTFSIMFRLIVCIHTFSNIITCKKIRYKNKKEQPPQAVLSYANLLLVIVILTAMTNAVES